MIAATEGKERRSAAHRTSFGELLRMYRRAAGLTQEDLADRAGYSSVYVSMLERGQRLPPPSTAGVLAGALALLPQDRSILADACRPDAAPSSRSGDPEFVGRSRELGLIERHLRGELAPVLLVAGEPGIGKTRLLREATLLAGIHGLRTLTGGCLRCGEEGPFAPVLQALQSHVKAQDSDRLREDLRGCAWLARLLPELTSGPIEQLPPWSVPPEQERRLMDDAVQRFLHNIGGPRGTLLVLDDLQWASTDALDLIRSLARSHESVTILAAYRESETGGDHPLSTLLADLAHGRLVTHVPLGRLSDEEAGELLNMLLEDAGDVEKELREQVLGQSDGVPFFVVSCAHGLRLGSLTGERGGAIPWDLTQSIRQRVSALPPAAKDLIGRAAVAGRRIPRSVLVAIGVENDDTLAAMDAACQARLLEESEGDTYQFSHDVIREVIEADLGPARRTVLHREIAEVLERRNTTVETLAYHFARSGDDDRAVHYLERAGRAAEGQHAHAAAEGYYRDLVDRLQRLGKKREEVEVRERLGHVLTALARYDDALSNLDQAAQEFLVLGDIEGEARSVAQIGKVHSLRGTLDEGIVRLEAYRARFEHGPTSHRAPSGWGALNIALAPLFMARGRYREQLDAAHSAAGIARALGDERMLAEAEVWRGCALNQLGDLAEGRRVQEAAIPLAESSRDLTSLVHALNDLGFLDELGGEFARSREHRERALQIAERLADPAAIANMTFRCGQTAFLSGDWMRARAYYERSVATARRIDASSILAYPLFGLGLLSLLQGDGQAAIRLAKECLDVGAQTGDRQVLHAGQSLLAETDLQEGRPEAALDRLRALEMDDEGLELYSIFPTASEACLMLGDLEHCHMWIEEGTRKANAVRSRVGLVDIQRVRVLLLLERESWSDAAEVLDDALRMARAMPYPYAVARLLLADARLHARIGRPDEARRQQAEAHVMFERLGVRQRASP